MANKGVDVRRFVCSPRNGGVLVIVLVTMIAVAFLASQGVRLMMLGNHAHEQRIKSAQVHELLELGRLRLADKNEAESFDVHVPGSQAAPDRVGKVTIEKKSNSDHGWRIIVRFPYNQPNEMTVTWESPS